jgi:serine/threonine protein kinase/Flp pilus assembly protein TadD
MLPNAIGHYRILERLGPGGMGEVYKAQDTTLPRLVAIKIPAGGLISDAKRMQRFAQEAEAASALNHPNICVIHEIGKTVDGIPFIVMEYINGETLTQRIKGMALNAEEVVRIGIQVADALEEAHAKGITHRDIKSNNIMINRRDQVKVLDFGLAKITSAIEGGTIEDITTQLNTDSGTMVGTIPYMSPEQALGRPLDRRTDIFSLGIVLYEMATGSLPFKGSTPAAVFDALLHKAPNSPLKINPGLPPELERIIQKALEKDPAARYQSTQEMALDLRRLERIMISQSRESDLPGFPRRRMVYVYGTIVGLVVSSLTGYFAYVSGCNMRPVKQPRAVVDTLPIEKRLVILSVRHDAGNPENGYLAEGLMELQSRKLNQLEQLYPSFSVVPPSEVREASVTSVVQAHRLFGVNLAITGSLDRTDHKLTLNLNLVDARTLQVLKSTTMASTLDNVADFQGRFIPELTRIIELELTPQMRRSVSTGDTTVREALENYLLGCGYLRNVQRRTEDLDLAISCFERACEQDPTYALPFSGLGEAYWQKFKIDPNPRWRDDAWKHFRRGAELNSELPAPHVAYGLLLTKIEKYQDAVNQFERALALDRVNAEAHRGLAEAYVAWGRPKDAERAYRRAIYLRPKDALARRRLGVFYHNQDQHEAAITEFREVVALAPENHSAYSSLGGIFFYLDRWDDAREAFERSLAIEKSDNAFSNLGTLYFYEARYKEAAQMYEKALQINDRDYRVWGNLGSAYHRIRGEEKKTQSAYRRAAEIAEALRRVNAPDAHLLADLSEYHLKLGEKQNGLRLLGQALRLAPGDTRVLVRAADIFEGSGQRDQALRCLDKALKLGYSAKLIERLPDLQQLRTDPRYVRLVRGTKPQGNGTDD